MRKTRVVHMRDRMNFVAKDFVRIDRTGKWGNPLKIGVHGDRAVVIEGYRQYLIAFPQIVEAARRELKGKILGCWCKPLPCHGDILARVADGEEP